MNDLAEKALDGLDAARRAVRAHPGVAVAVAGFLASLAIMVLGARIGAAPDAVPINGWLGLLPGAGYQVIGPGVGLAMIAAVAALVLVWLITLGLATRARLTERALWGVGAAWAAPFALGPPLLNTELYRSIAFGLLARDGLSPYHHDPTQLGEVRIVVAIDPVWRGTPSSAGPVTTLLQHVAVSVAGGRVVFALIALRLLAIAAVVVIGRCAVLLGGGRGDRALTMTALNPALLLFGVSAGQFEAVFAALVLLALVAARAGRWSIAVVTVCVAAGVDPYGLLAVPVLVIAHAAAARRRHGGRRHRGTRYRRARWAAVGGDLLLVAATLTVCSLAVPHGLGWVANLGDSIRPDIVFAPASVLADVVGWIVPPASFDDLQTGGRISAGLAALTVLAFVNGSAARRGVAVSTGFALLTGSVLSPVVTPAMLLFALLVLAPVVRGAYRGGVVALSVFACLLAPVGLTERAAQLATLIVLAVIVLALAARGVARARDAGRTAVVPLTIES